MLNFGIIVFTSALLVMGILFLMVMASRKIVIDMKTDRQRYNVGEQIRVTISINAKKPIEINSATLELRCKLDWAADAGGGVFYSVVQPIKTPSMLSNDAITRTVELLAPSLHELSGYASLSDSQKEELEWELITVVKTPTSNHVRDIDLILDLSPSSS